MKRAVLSLPLLLVLFSCTIAAAQNRKIANESADLGFNLRTSLTSYFDYDAGIMLGVGYRWSNRFSAAIEPTWILFNASNVNQDEIIIPKGIKLRADIKYHFSKRRRKADFFIAPEFHYKNVKTEKEATFGINCQNGQCAFFQDALYTEGKKETGGLLKLGLLTPFPFVKNDNLLLEIYGGFLGVKIQKFTESDLPIGGSFFTPPERSIIFPTNERNIATLPIIPFGLKVVFLL
jgi:hypothetical protein